MPEYSTLQFESADIFVIDTEIPKSDYVVIDMSNQNEELRKIDISSAKIVEHFITAYVATKGGQAAIGGYLEVRDLYKRSKYFNGDANQERNIHLGVDIWIKEGTKVLAALDGEVHSFKNNTNHGDYGPTIVLKHKYDGVTFHTLYGHLSIASIQGLEIGQKVTKSQHIGALGGPSVNGGYAPHLHFQVILDMQDYVGDYPGVCSFNNLSFYKMNCPNAMNLLGFQDYKRMC